MPRIGDAMTAQRKIRKPIQDEYRCRDVEHREEQRREDRDKARSDPIHSLLALQIAVRLRILSLDLLRNLHPLHLLGLDDGVAKSGMLFDELFLLLNVSDLASYRTGPYLMAVGLSAEPRRPRSQFL